MYNDEKNAQDLPDIKASENRWKEKYMKGKKLLFLKKNKNQSKTSNQKYELAQQK